MLSFWSGTRGHQQGAPGGCWEKHEECGGPSPASAHGCRSVKVMIVGSSQPVVPSVSSGFTVKKPELVYGKLMLDNNCDHLGTFSRHFIHIISRDIG